MDAEGRKRGAAARAYQWLEDGLDGPLGGANPLRHLGSLGFLLFWMVAASGIYLYAVLDTSVEGIYRSIDAYSREQWYLAGWIRSLHRYASDAFVVVMLLHLLREFLLGRYSGFRWFSWITGVPVIWLAYASGIGGFWIVWDQLAQFSAIATAEWLDWLPIFSDPMTRNFLGRESVTDRFFSLLVFIHIGVPLILLAALWLHIQRITRPEVFPPRPVAWGVTLALLALCFARPVMSDPPADLAMAPVIEQFDWFLLFIHPLMYASSPGAAWGLATAATLLLLALPLLPSGAPAPIARVDPANCNGCRRCFEDCPYAAVEMVPHPDGRAGAQLARVLPDLCASCGICSGSCPSSTPFRATEDLVTGIDMPQLPVAALRQRLDAGLAAMSASQPVVVFGCERGADVGALADARTLAMPLICTGMLPPSFIEYALRAGAAGVMVTGCRSGGCEYRFGTEWTEQRLAGRREPHLRTSVPRQRLSIVWAGAGDAVSLARTLAEFRRRLTDLGSEPLAPPGARSRSLLRARPRPQPLSREGDGRYER